MAGIDKKRKPKPHEYFIKYRAPCCGAVATTSINKNKYISDLAASRQCY
jgi:hypothetical protein